MDRRLFLASLPALVAGTTYFDIGASYARQGWVEGAEGLLRPGDIVTIDGVFADSPLTPLHERRIHHISGVRLQEFVITEDAHRDEGELQVKLHPRPPFRVACVRPWIVNGKRAY